MIYIFNRKHVEVIIFAPYNVKKHGKVDELFFKSKRCDVKKKISIKDVVRKKQLVFEHKS